MDKKYKMVNSALIELTRSEIAEHSNVPDIQNIWKLNRIAEYPSVQEQLDMQYWDGINGTSLWADLITEIKAKHPK